MSIEATYNDEYKKKFKSEQSALGNGVSAHEGVSISKIDRPINLTGLL